MIFLTARNDSPYSWLTYLAIKTMSLSRLVAAVGLHHSAFPRTAYWNSVLQRHHLKSLQQ